MKTFSFLRTVKLTIVLWIRCFFILVLFSLISKFRNLFYTKGSHLESVHILIEHYIKNHAFKIKPKQVFDICRLLSSNNYILQLNFTDLSKKSNLNHVNNTKLRICRILFERLNFKLKDNISAINSTLDESLFSICCGYGYGNCNCIEYSVEYYNYLFKILCKQECGKCVEQILIETLLNKLKHSFEINIDLIEKLIVNIDNKQNLYKSLESFENLKLLNPNDSNIKNYQLQPPNNKGYSKNLNNSYFIKQQMFVKYGVIPMENRLDWLTKFLLYWTEKCAVRRSTYVSASTIVRFINLDEMLQNMLDYYEHLIKYGFLTGNKLNPVKWWKNLINDKIHGKLLMEMLNDEQREKIEFKLNQLFFKYKTLFVEPLSLKLISRNRIRYLINSLSTKNLSNLKLPKNLSIYLTNY